MASTRREVTSGESSLSTPPPEPFSSSSSVPSSNAPSSSSDFDIVSTYRSLLRADPDLTMPLAAISSLILLLSHTPPSTISETLSLLSDASATLQRSVRNPIALSAGTDLFQRYIVSTLQSPSSTTTTTTARSSSSSSREGKGTAGGDEEEEEDGFRGVRDHLLSSGRLFAERAKEARGLIAGTARKFVRDGGTVLTAGRSRVVGAVLAAAAEAGTRFRVVYVRDGADAITSTKGTDMVEQLRRKGIPVAVIAPEAAAYSLGQVTSVMVGAEGVVENGGVISRMGTYQLAMLAKSAGKPFHVVAESHKFVRLYPLGQYDLPIRQTVLEFREADSEKVKDGEGASGGGREGEDDEGAVDYTPPELITALVTEVGVHTPTAVSEELIKIWY